MRLLLQLTDQPTDPPAGGPPAASPLALRVDGEDVEVPDDGSSLLDVLRHLGRRSVKDGCSPQGQCGCCTVWVDGAPRVACVTPARRVAGRSVTTLEGLDPALSARWADAFCDAGASQCGFCTPGIVMRLAGLAERRPGFGDDDLDRALAAHLCRCTGWRSMHEAARAVRHGDGPRPGRDLDAAARRAELEGGAPQVVGLEVARGRGGFAEDTAPADALVAVPDGSGGWVVGETLRAARAAAGKRQGRNSTVALRHPLTLPEGDWALTLCTTFVEPAYLEPDASWCVPGGEPASPLANGGAFGAKRGSPVAEAARRLADEHGRPVRVVLAREDVVRTGPKRPPIAAGVRPDGTGLLRVARTPAATGLDRWRAALASAAPGLVVEEVDVAGPPVSADLRAAGWAEGVVLMAALGHLRRGGTVGRAAVGTPVEVGTPGGPRATATVAEDGSVAVGLAAGEVLDEVVLRSYALGALHQALGWVRSEGVAVDEAGEVLDLTIRSFGILPARAMPPVDVAIVEDEGRPAVPGSDAVFAAVAAAAWIAGGLGPTWPTDRGGTT
ncbi:MAG TPA: 2Fe-2S iron-sulfur cluster-binding protein [Acidimicrobiales bacterium]|nr:2Fe-2S iron-sulfur cluster-binding protein [Acidimicrobiales bacterium]